MTLRTPWIPPLQHERNSSGDISNSARIGTPPIGAAQWMDIARAQNWLLVGGSMQLASWGPNVIVGAGATSTLRAYCWPRPQCFARLWTFVLRGIGAFGTITTADGAHSFATNPDTSSTVIHIPELVTDTTPTGEAISVAVAVDANSDPDVGLVIQSVTCTEIPLKRAAKSGDATGLGVHETSLDKWKQIGELDSSTTEQRSVGGVMRVAAQNYEGQHALRRKLFDWGLIAGVTTSSSTFANLFRINPSCQARQVLGETSRSCRWAVYASASSSAGEVRLTSSIDGSTNTISVTSTTPAWVQSPTAFNCATDDIGAAGWVRGSRETCQIDIRATAGNLVIYNVAIGER